MHFTLKATPWRPRAHGCRHLTVAETEAPEAEQQVASDELRFQRPLSPSLTTGLCLLVQHDRFLSVYLPSTYTYSCAHVFIAKCSTLVIKVQETQVTVQACPQVGRQGRGRCRVGVRGARACRWGTVSLSWCAPRVTHTQVQLEDPEAPEAPSGSLPANTPPVGTANLTLMLPLRLGQTSHQWVAQRAPFPSGSFYQRSDGGPSAGLHTAPVLPLSLPSSAAL